MSKKKIFLFTMLILSLSLGMINSIPEVNEKLPYSPHSADSEDPLLAGTTSLGNDLDPTSAWDSASDAVIDQVSEGLFAYSLVNRDLTIVPRLASNYGSWNYNNTEFTVPLRQNVFFHNGQAFNATTVKNSFDRLHHLIELSVVPIESLYKPLNDEFVINSVEIINEFIVKFVLNYSYAPFEALLCFSASYIVDTSVMPADDILDPAGILIGTGPYKHMGNDGSKVYFEYFPTYYRGIPAVKYMQYIKYPSPIDLSIALLNGEVDTIHSYDLDYFDSFQDSDNVIVENQEIGAVFYYLAMNNEKINKTMRQAISYAIDYESIISDIYGDTMVRADSILPPKIMYYKECDVATLDISLARQKLINAGLSKGLDEYSSDLEWITLSKSLDPVVEYNFTYNEGNINREKLCVQLQFDLSRIGISVVMENITWMEYLDKLLNYPEQLDLHYLGWAPDYNDPDSYFSALLANTSTNHHLLNDDVWLQNKIIEGLNETDKVIRRQIYYDIQDYITTDLMPIGFIGFNTIETMYGKNVKNYPVNPLNKKYYYYCTWWEVSPIVIDTFVDAYHIDSDRDGLWNSDEENIYGSDPLDTDSDDDGLLDGEEVFNYGTDPMNTDSDTDGLSDWEEIINFETDPLDDDTDNDGLLDGEEINDHQTDPLDADTDDDDYEVCTWTFALILNHDANSFPNDIDPFMYFQNIPGYSSIIVSLCLISTITILIWKSKRNKINFLRK